MDSNLINKVKTLFENQNLNPNNIRLVLLKNPTIKSNLDIEFNSNKKKYGSIGKLVISIIKDIQFKHCIICNKELTYDQTIANSLFCSNKCKLSKEGNPYSRYKDKIKKSNIEKYGVDNPAKSNIIQNKIKNTCLEKYKVENVFQSTIIKSKIKETIKEKYGVDNIYQNKDILIKAKLSKNETTYNKIKQHYQGIIEPAFNVLEYNGVRKYYKWKCVKCGNIFEAAYNNGMVCSRCFNCYPRKINSTSKYEKEIIDYLKSFNINIDSYNREIIAPQELDIVIPDKKIAIEFNGTYWHSMNNLKSKTYHLDKTNKCLEAGYRLIHIFEYDWVNPTKQKIIKEKLKAILNINQSKIYARKCIIKELSAKEKNIFLNENHIQGADQSTIKLGLFYNDELVSVMTFNKPRFNKKYDWELVRYASKSGYRVIGGAGKLLSYFKKHYSGSIITYADKKYSIGNMYLKLGLTHLYDSFPNYIWINNDQIYTRYQTQKFKLKTLLKNFDPNQSEEENMLNAGYLQIFDCGNMVFEINK